MCSVVTVQSARPMPECIKRYLTPGFMILRGILHTDKRANAKELASLATG